jgi:hypothetical protein
VPPPIRQKGKMVSFHVTACSYDFLLVGVTIIVHLDFVIAYAGLSLS